MKHNSDNISWKKENDSKRKIPTIRAPILHGGKWPTYYLETRPIVVHISARRMTPSRGDTENNGLAQNVTLVVELKNIDNTSRRPRFKSSLFASAAKKKSILIQAVCNIFSLKYYHKPTPIRDSSEPIPCTCITMQPYHVMLSQGPYPTPQPPSPPCLRATITHALLCIGLLSIRHVCAGWPFHSSMPGDPP